uniref:hypothetical protein n=1 Tax=Sphingobacterium bovisgrunnientis TaxID=1874697 RepID=UPI00135C3B30
MSRDRGDIGSSTERLRPVFESLPNPIFDTTFIATTTTSRNTMSDSEHDAPYRTLHDYLHPTRTSTPSCIMFPPNMPR